MRWFHEHGAGTGGQTRGGLNAPFVRPAKNKIELQNFKEEMKAFKEEMRIFKEEMQAFKEGMNEFKE